MITSNITAISPSAFCACFFFLLIDSRSLEFIKIPLPLVYESTMNKAQFIQDTAVTIIIFSY